MASQAYELIRDQNSRFHFNGASIGGKNNSSKAVMKKGIGGRKPLGDVSNSVKPTPSQAPKKLGRTNFTENAPAVPKTASAVGKKQSVSGASEKGRADGRRKALADISNSGKPNVAGASKKNLKKPNVVTEFSVHPDTIAEEGFLHNHDECIKEQTEGIEIDEFLKTIGLEDGSSYHSAFTISSPVAANLKTPAKFLEEMAEPSLIENFSAPPPKSPICKTPKGLDRGAANFIGDDCNFELVETPAL